MDGKVILSSINPKKFGMNKWLIKELLKNEVELYVDSDDALTEHSLRVSVQEEKVNYLEAVLRQINNRGFQIKNAIDWNRFITG